MNSEKRIAFMEKLLVATKEKKISWSRVDMHLKIGVRGKCFSCHIPGIKNMEIMLMTENDSEYPYLVIYYDEEMPGSELRAENPEERSTLLRLFNYIYNLFPTLESSIDWFLENF